MSCNRENVTWQSADGSWNNAHFEYYVWGEDSEWDVDYDRSKFGWASTGHSSSLKAQNAWQGANPGGTTIVEHSRATKAECARYDAMVWALRNPEAAAKREQAKKRTSLRKSVAALRLIESMKVIVTTTTHRSHTGYLVAKDGWLGLELDNSKFLKVLSLSTNAPSSKIAGVERVMSPVYSYAGSYRRW